MEMFLIILPSCIKFQSMFIPVCFLKIAPKPDVISMCVFALKSFNV